MFSLILLWIINAVTLLVVAKLLPGFQFASLYSAFVTFLILGFVNALIRPIVLLFTLPVNILTLGLFTFVVNALMLWLVASVVKGFTIDVFSTALLAALLLWLMSFLSNLIANLLAR
jgi:putative membrane protein